MYITLSNVHGKSLPDVVSLDDVSLDSLDVELELAAEVALDAALLAEVDELALDVVDELAPEPPVELEVSVEPDGPVVVLGAVVALLFALELAVLSLESDDMSLVVSGFAGVEQPIANTAAPTPIGPRQRA